MGVADAINFAKAYSYEESPTLKEFAQSNAKIRGLMGPFGSGKSSACVVEIVRRGLAQAKGADGVRRTKFAVVRNTHPQLRDTTIQTFMQWFPPQMFGTYNVSSATYTITAFPDTEIIVCFRALDRPEQVTNLLSAEYTGAWINEAKDIPHTIMTHLYGRTGRYPAPDSDGNGGCTWNGLWMDTNPPDTDSWWYTMFEEERKDGIEIYKQPSGLSDEAENLKFLKPGYYQDMMDMHPKEFTDVYVHGKYGFVQDGLPVYSNYNDNTHCDDTIHAIEGQPILLGWDFGMTPAVVIGQQQADGRLLIIDEIVSQRMDVAQFADEVAQYLKDNYPTCPVERNICDPAGNDAGQQRGETCYMILMNAGFGPENGQQDPTYRTESVKAGLDKNIMGLPALAISPKAVTLRKGFIGKYRLKRKQVGGATSVYRTVPDKDEYSHVHDALQYLCTRYFGPATTGKGNFGLELEYPNYF